MQHVSTFSKKSLLLCLLGLSAALFGCSYGNLPTTIPPRKVKFEIYTDQDLSKETNHVIFHPSISAGGVLLWDSVFVSIPIADIPSYDHAITFEKVILNNKSDLKVGFEYSIENVGYSWFYEQMPSGELSRTVSFNFK
jgi:hypothetical protein